MSGALGWPAAAHGRNDTPGEVTGGHRFRAITTGMQFSCALTEAEGRAYCWGWGAMTGSGDADASGPTPRPVAGDRSFTEISAGEYHTCALGTDRKAYCWGLSEPPFGSVRPAPVPIATPRPLTGVVSGKVHTCALDDQRRALCWRTGNDVQYVEGDHRFAGLAGGNEVSCGWTEGGAAYCWNFGFVHPFPRNLARVPSFPTE
jgi:alpha-tubulin suppressor-like RCC1 family protein